MPVLTPRLSSLWIHLVTPVPHTIARPLAEGLRNRTVCRNDDAVQLMPQHLLTMREAIDAVLVVLPRTGAMSFRAIVGRDYPVVFATLYIFTLMGLVMQIVGDFTYTLVDPRIDFETREV